MAAAKKISDKAPETKGPEPETKPYTVTIELSPKNRQAFRALAKSKNISAGGLLSQLISEAVAKPTS